MAERGTDQYLADRYPGTGGDPRPLRPGEKPLDSWQAPGLVPSHDTAVGPYRQQIRQKLAEKPLLHQLTSETGYIRVPPRQGPPAPAEAAPEPQTAESAAYDRERGREALPPISRGGRQ